MADKKKKSDSEKTEKVQEKKPVIVEELSKEERADFIYQQANRIQYLENELKQRSNPIHVLSDNADNLISLIKNTADKWLEIKKTTLGFNTKMSLFASLIILMIVGSAGWLTYEGKIDGSTFTFLLGLIVGYALTFIQNLINPPQ